MYELKEAVIYNGSDDLWNILLTESMGLELNEIIVLPEYTLLREKILLSDDVLLDRALLHREN